MQQRRKQLLTHQIYQFCSGRMCYLIFVEDSWKRIHHPVDNSNSKVTVPEGCFLHC